ncbi:MAG: PspC domain-containing protein [Chloroflexi bacterium]|nr:PspC domain-containing protein [Chloroflexota bacterium]
MLSSHRLKSCNSSQGGDNCKRSSITPRAWRTCKPRNRSPPQTYNGIRKAALHNLNGGKTVNPERRLYRSTKDRMFAGVCGGIAEYLEVDPTLVRLVFVALTLLSSGAGLAMYVIMMLIVPEEPRDVQPTQPYKAKRADSEEPVVTSSIPVPNDTDSSQSDA